MSRLVELLDKKNLKKVTLEDVIKRKGNVTYLYTIHKAV